MFTHHYTEAVILSELIKGEADKVFTVYTRDFGKINLLGRSIRKGKSKLGMNFQLFSHVRTGFIEGRGYKTITDVSGVSSFKKAKRNLGKLSLFYRISELFLTFIKGEEKDEKVFIFLLSAFEEIDKADFSVKEIELFYCFFSFQLMRFLGYEPHIQSCAVCKKKIEKDCFFDLEEGGAVCCFCFKKKPFSVYLKDIRILSFFLHLDIKDFPQDAKAPDYLLSEFLFFVSENPYFKK